MRSLPPSIKVEINDPTLLDAHGEHRGRAGFLRWVTAWSDSWETARRGPRRRLPRPREIVPSGQATVPLRYYLPGRTVGDVHQVVDLIGADHRGALADAAQRLAKVGRAAHKGNVADGATVGD